MVCGTLADGVASSFHKASIEAYLICIDYAKGFKMYDDIDKTLAVFICYSTSLIRHLLIHQ